MKKKNRANLLEERYSEVTLKFSLSFPCKGQVSISLIRMAKYLFSKHNWMCTYTLKYQSAIILKVKSQMNKRR